MTNLNTDYSHELLNKCLKVKAVKYLEDKLLESMKDDIESIATQAVSQWASIKFSQDIKDFGVMNINIAFIEDVIKHHNIPNPISITINKKDK